MVLPELPGNVPAHRESAQVDGLANLQGIEQARQVIGELPHRGCLVPAVALAETSEIGRDHPIANGQDVDLLRPHAVIEREPVHQQDDRAGAAVYKGQLEIANGDAPHFRPPRAA